MPLNHILSAVRQLILDESTPDISERGRCQYLAERFPDLTESEVNDLAEIPPDRMGVYTRLIFNGERTMLKWVYPVTFAALHRIDADVDEFNLMRDLHRHRPWTSQSSRELADIFQDYVVHRRLDWQSACPALLDLIESEKTSLQVFYALDFPHNPIDIAQWNRFSVGELLEQPVIIPPYIALRTFACDIVEFTRRYRREDSLPDDWPAMTTTHAVCSRDPETLMPRWLTLSDPAFCALSAITPATPTLANDLAQHYIEAATPELRADEQALFQSFFTFLSQASGIGAIAQPMET